MSSDFQQFNFGHSGQGNRGPLPNDRNTARWEPEVDFSQRLPAQVYGGWSIVVSFVTILSCAICIVTHYTIRDINAPQWWITVLLVLAGAGFLTFLAFYQAPAEGHGQRKSVLGLAANCLVMLTLAATVYALTFLPMSFILFIKSAAGQQAIRQARDRAETARRLEFNRQQNLQASTQRYHREMQRLAEATRTAERALYDAEVAESKQIEREDQIEAQRLAQVEKKMQTEYSAALIAGLLTSNQPLPKVSGLVTWPPYQATPIDHRWLEFPQDRTPVELLVDTKEANGLTIRRLKLTGREFLPEIGYLTDYISKQLVFVRRSNCEVLEVSPTDFRLTRTTTLGGYCHDLHSMRDTICLARSDPDTILTIQFPHAYAAERDPLKFKSYSLHAPRRVTAAPYLLFHVVNGHAPPLWAKIYDGNVKQVQEYSKVCEGTRFLPEQLGRDSFASANREVVLAQKDGVYRGQLQAASSKRSLAVPTTENGGYVSLDGKHYVTIDEELPIEQIPWTKILPATGIDVTKSATLGPNLLATCNDKWNLLLFDQQGKPHSQHTWLDAGKTLGIVSAGNRQLLIVFTENSVFAVTLSGASIDPPKLERPKYKVVTNPIQPQTVERSIAGKVTRIPGGQVTQLKLDAQGWLGPYALEGSTVHKIDQESFRIERSIELAPVGTPITQWGFARRVVVLVPQRRQLITLDHYLKPTTYELNDFPANQAGGYFSAYGQSDTIAITVGPPGKRRTDIVNTTDGSVELSIDPKLLKPPLPELRNFILHSNGLLAVEQGRLYLVRWNPQGWQQIDIPEPRTDYPLDATLAAWDDGWAYVETKDRLEPCQLERRGKRVQAIAKPRGVQVKFTSDSVWFDNGKKFDLSGKELRSLELPKTGGGLLVGSYGRLIIGNQLIELDSPNP